MATAPKDVSFPLSPCAFCDAGSDRSHPLPRISVQISGMGSEIAQTRACGGKMPVHRTLRATIALAAALLIALAASGLARSAAKEIEGVPLPAAPSLPPPPVPPLPAPTAPAPPPAPVPKPKLPPVPQQPPVPRPPPVPQAPPKAPPAAPASPAAPGRAEVEKAAPSLDRPARPGGGSKARDYGTGAGTEGESGGAASPRSSASAPSNPGGGASPKGPPAPPPGRQTAAVGQGRAAPPTSFVAYVWSAVALTPIQRFLSTLESGLQAATLAAPELLSRLSPLFAAGRIANFDDVAAVQDAAALPGDAGASGRGPNDATGIFPSGDDSIPLLLVLVLLALLSASLVLRVSQELGLGRRWRLRRSHLNSG
jgi:outer membrane biosynthesis protein TonB